ncbi:MAG: T9SS type A sorting domain-containing protein [bacterium]
MTDPPAENPATVNAKLIIGTVEGDHTEFYSVDTTGKISFPDSNHHLSHVYTFTDENLVSGNRLKQVDFNRNFEYPNLMDKAEVEVPSKFELSQNFPNPFNPSTTINFDMPIDGFVSLKIFNSSGKEVATLLNESRTSGYHSVNFDASNLSSGIYYYKLETNNFSKVMKMALIK